MNNIISHGKVLLGIVASYIIVATMSQVFFIGDSPLLRSHPEQYIALKVNNKMSTLIAGLGFGKKPSITADDYKQFMNTAAANSLQQVAPATYAADIKGQRVEIFKAGEAPIEEYSFLINGKLIQIRTDANKPKLSQQEVEKMMVEFGASDPSTR